MAFNPGLIGSMAKVIPLIEVKKMYRFVDWYSCRHCGRSACLFKTRIDKRHKERTGKIRLMDMRVCQTCYRQIERDKRAVRLSDPKTRKKVLDRQKEMRDQNPERYAAYQKKSYWKHREARLEYNRTKRKRPSKQISEIVLKARIRESIRVSQYVDGSTLNYRRRKNASM